MRVQCYSPSNESMNGFICQEVQAVRIFGLDGQMAVKKGRPQEAQASLLLSYLTPSLQIQKLNHSPKQACADHQSH